jgi:hypothetical protein
MPNHPGFFIGDGDDFVVHLLSEDRVGDGDRGAVHRNGRPHNWRPLDAHFTFAIGQPSG